jgi:hypothetical protein
VDHLVAAIERRLDVELALRRLACARDPAGLGEDLGGA